MPPHITFILRDSGCPSSALSAINEGCSRKYKKYLERRQNEERPTGMF